MKFNPKAVAKQFGTHDGAVKFICNMPDTEKMKEILGSAPEIEIQVDLIFKDNEQDIVSGGFKVFDCNKFSSCGSCLGMSNSCVWCFTDNLCAPDRNHCKGLVRYEA